MRTRHVPKTRGGQAVQTWLQEQERSQEWLVEEIKRRALTLRQSTVSGWIKGAVPGMTFALLLEEICGIPVRWWTEPADASSIEEHASPFDQAQEVA